jgi:hypothetical protein
MSNRKKRLKKGLDSIEEQILLHKQKQNESENKGEIEMVEYYKKEIEGLEKTKDKKKTMLEKAG